MSKVTIGVYKAYKNSGNLRFHKRNAKKHWKHYFIEVDDYDEEEYSFGSEWVSSTDEIFQKNGWLVKNIGIRENPIGTIMYLLSHAGVKKRRHTS